MRTSVGAQIAARACRAPPPRIRPPPLRETPSTPLRSDPGRPDEARPWRRLAARLGIAFRERIDVVPLPADVDPPAPEAIRRADRLMQVDAREPTLTAAPGADLVPPMAELLARHPGTAHRVAIATPREIRRALIERHAPALARRAVRSVIDHDPDLSALRPASLVQLALLPGVALIWLAGALAFSETLLVGWTVFFLTLGLLRAHIADALPEPVDHPPVSEEALPRFAVLVPLHREAAVVGGLVAALSRLDYPPDRLDLRLVLEEDDLDTRATAEAAVAGTPIETIVVPAIEPRTKPKALNFALACVDAPFVTVYDAEDRPDPGQLRRAAAAFAAGDPELAVVQAALEIDHAENDRPWLVRQFEIEYAMLFHGLLPWLARHHLFLPLGGTSNHFRRTALAAVGGWDPHNVTEDADVAVRLMRAGWRADVVGGATSEEAPLDLPRWRAQRVRWLKGWMVTWLVHMRRPIRFHRAVGLFGALSFHLILAGQLVSMLVFAPSLVLLAAQGAGVVPLFGDRGFGADLLLVAGLLGLTAGSAGSLVLASRVETRIAAAHRRRFRLFDIATMPVYWCLVSLAAYRALGELVRAPHRWNKTTHGLAERRSDATATSTPAKPRSPLALRPVARLWKNTLGRA